ncbi:MAG TPA: lysophospholipid acyltransferase family protein [Anaerolineales bacterium]|nr:lysophospholipid acyltransferase family protein [Anaerolineales bacterium]
MTQSDLTASIPPSVLARASAAAEGYDPKARLWPVFKAVLWLYKVVCVRHVRVSGRERIVPGGRILVSNHARVSDSFLLPFIFGRLHGMAQVESFTLPILGPLLARAGQVPVIPGRGREALERAEDLLLRGETILIYPEGRLSHGSVMLRGKTGAARLALRSGAPFQPVAVHVPEQHTRVMRGHFYGRPTVGVWQFGGTAYVAIGEAWHPFAPREIELGFTEVRRVTDEIMERVRALVEQARRMAG